MKNNFPQLSTERLVLRKLETSDWKMISYLRTDPKVNQFVKRSMAETEEKALQFIKKTVLDINTGSLVQWCICTNNNPEMIGTICLWNISKDRKTAEVGYDLIPAFHKKGIMNEALREVLRFGFENLDLQMIEAFTQLDNLASKNLLIRNGFILNDKRVDEDNSKNHIYELLKPVAI